MHGITAVDDAGEVGDEQLPTGGDETTQVGGRRFVEQVHLRHDHQPVTSQIRCGMSEVGRDVVLPELGVERHRALPVVQIDGGAPLLVLRPEGLPVPQDRHLRLYSGSADLAERLHGASEGDHLVPLSRVRAAVRQHRRVELLRAGAGGPPLEEHHASAPRATWARLLRRISPGRLATLRGCQFTAPGRVLHQQPRPAAGQRPGEVGGHGQADLVVRRPRRSGSGRWRPRRPRRPSATSRCPGAGGGHEVGGDRHVRA